MPSQKNIHGQLYCGAGLWLIMSPFVLFSQASLSTGSSVEVTLSTMFMGFLALVVAGLNQRHYGLLRSVLGGALGIATMGGPWVIGYVDRTLAAVNACILGVAIMLIVVAEFVSTSSQRSHS